MAVRNIFLPGTDKQLVNVLNNIELSDKTVLIIGAGTEEIAQAFSGLAQEVIIIVEDHENLLQLRSFLAGNNNISVRLMQFDNKDFKDERFDVIYAQASVSTSNRNKIIKEVKRILKPGGFFCVGEIIKLKEEVPRFVQDIWDNSALLPLFINDLNNYYSAKSFKIVFEKDLSATLKDFYSISITRLKDNAQKLSEQEQSYYKKLLKKISHESNAYLRLGGDIIMGFKMLILRKV